MDDSGRQQETDWMCSLIIYMGTNNSLVDLGEIQFSTPSTCGVSAGKSLIAW